MTYGEEEGGTIAFDTSRGRDWPSVRQFNIFLANRMGALLDLVRKFEMTDVCVVSLTVVETADCAIIRLVPSDYERAYEILQALPSLANGTANKVWVIPAELTTAMANLGAAFTTAKQEDTG